MHGARGEGWFSDSPPRLRFFTCTQFTKIRLYSQTGSAFLTDEQQEWVEVVKIIARLRPIEKVG